MDWKAMLEIQEIQIFIYAVNQNKVIIKRHDRRTIHIDGHIPVSFPSKKGRGVISAITRTRVRERCASQVKRDSHQARAVVSKFDDGASIRFI